MSTKRRYRATVVAAVILAGGAVTSAALDVVGQQLQDQQRVVIDCGAYLRMLSDIAVANPDLGAVVADAASTVNFGRHPEVCGDPGPILRSLTTPPTAISPSTTTGPP